MNRRYPAPNKSGRKEGAESHNEGSSWVNPLRGECTEDKRRRKTRGQEQTQQYQWGLVLWAKREVGRTASDDVERH